MTKVEALKATLWITIDHLKATQNNTQQAVDDICKLVIEPLRRHANTTTFDETLLRGQWEIVFPHSSASPVTQYTFPTTTTHAHQPQATTRSTTTLAHLSLGALPQISSASSPVTILRTLQEVEPTTQTYNTVAMIESGSVRAYCIVFGHYEILPDTTHFAVTMERVALRPVEDSGVTTETLRAAFGLADTSSSIVEHQVSPALAASTTLVYIDHDTRIHYQHQNGRVLLWVMKLRVRQVEGICTKFLESSVSMQEDAPVKLTG